MRAIALGMCSLARELALYYVTYTSGLSDYKLSELHPAGQLNTFRVSLEGYHA